MEHKDFEHYHKSTLFNQLMGLPENIESALDKPCPKILSKKICVFAIGESVVAADIISSYLDKYADTQITIVNDERIPGWIGYDTACILISNSGYNDIINRIYNELKTRNSAVYCITSGGILKNRCVSNNDTLIQIADRSTPRTTVGIELSILAELCNDAAGNQMKKMIAESLPMVKKFRDELIAGKIVPKELICRLRDKSIAIYGTSELRAACRRWKAAFNTDTRCLAFCSELPEFDHNELVGWANHKQPTENIEMVVLKCDTEPVLDQIIQSMIIVLKENGRDVIVMEIPGSNPIEKNLCAILLGDYISQKISDPNKMLRGLPE